MLDGMQYDRHAIVDVEQFFRRVDHDARVAVPPFIGWPPYSRPCRGGLIFDADPCARHLPLRPPRLCKRGERDQTALRGCREQMFPKRREPGVILRPGSERYSGP